MKPLLGIEPAMIIGAVTAGLVFAVSFGVPITVEQREAIIAFASAMLVLIGAYVTRQRVVPAAKVEAAHGTIGLEQAANVTPREVLEAQAHPTAHGLFPSTSSYVGDRGGPVDTEPVTNPRARPPRPPTGPA